MYSIAKDESQITITKFRQPIIKSEYENHSSEHAYQILSTNKITVPQPCRLEKVQAFGAKIFVTGNGFHILSQYIGD